ncbi:MAG: hypothetical protein D6B27_05105 [Gammaproteobacteria bacterium]|nr:MAG: hypothetical protein D6B27_05105 [Gammaproteobacteria bacterium]
MSLLSLFTASDQPAECRILVGSEKSEITDYYPYLKEVKVECSRKEAAVATLTFDTVRDLDGSWIIQDSETFVPWAPIVIEAVFGDKTEEVMRGYIREISADYPSDETSVVTVNCQDESIALDREHVGRAWGASAPTTDAVILADIAGNHGLTVHPDSQSGKSSLVINQDATDIVFLKDRAKANGYELIIDQGKIYFGPMRLEAQPQETIMVYAGEETNCISFSSNVDSHSPDKVSIELAQENGAGVVTRIIESDLPLMGTTAANSDGSGLKDFTWKMRQDGSGVSEEDRITLAQAKANELAMKVKANGTIDGSFYGHVLRVGEPVPVDGIGEWLGGIYYTDSVVHRFSHEGYQQDFSLIRNAFGDNLESGLLGALAALI